jgi:hypothetical protein
MNRQDRTHADLVFRGIHAIRQLAAFCQQGELGFRAIRRTLERRIHRS